jgi:putative transposase
MTLTMPHYESSTQRAPQYYRIKGEYSLVNESWLTTEDVAVLTGQSEQYIRRLCQKGKWVTRTISKIDGGRAYRIALSSLPLEVQQLVWRSEHPQNADDVIAKRKADLPEEYSEREEQIALAKYTAIKKYVQAAAAKRFGNIVKAKDIFISQYNRKIFPDLYALTGEITLKTAERWRKQLELHGWDYRCLIRNYGANRGQRKVPQEIADILLKNMLNPNAVSKAYAVANTLQECEVMGIDTSTVSDTTLRRWADDWVKQNYDRWIYMREGKQQMDRKVLPYVVRDYDAIEYGDVLVADGHVLNFTILNPYTGKPKRMVFLAFIDMKTLLPVGWTIMPTENTACISEALFYSVRTLGFVPKVVYLDNGRAFQSKFFAGKSMESVEGLYKRLGINVQTAWPYHGQSKPIEPWFRYMSNFSKLLPSYTGTSIDKKPAHMNRGEAEHRQLFGKITNTSPTMFEAEVMIHRYLEEYTALPQNHSHLKGMSPIEAMEESRRQLAQQTDWQARQISAEKLAYMMMDRKIVSLDRNGIRHWGYYYYAPELFSMQKGEGKAALTIRYDLHDRDSVLVYDDHGKYICTAERVRAQHPSAALIGSQNDVESLAKAIEMKKSALKSTVSAAKNYVKGQELLLTTPELPERKLISAWEDDAIPENENENSLDIIRDDESDFADDDGRIYLFESERQEEDE